MNWVIGLQRQFDIYSERWPQRLAVYLSIAIGGFLLATNRVEGALPFAFLIWANHPRLFDSWAARLRRHPWLILVPAIVVIALRVALPAPAAHDDLLRHIASSFWPGGYRDMYVYSSLPPNELYPSFDWVVGMLARQFGALPAMWLVQGTAWVSFVVVFVAAALRVLPNDEDRLYWVLGALLLVISTVALRLTLGRPEVFMGIWALAALLPTKRAGALAWAGVGMLLGTGYWLAPLYFPAVLLLPLGARMRLQLFAVMVVCWYGLWFVTTGANPTDAIAWLREVVQSRVITPGEGASAVTMVGLPGIVVLLGTAIWAAAQPKRDLRPLLLAVYFVLPNQWRYVSVVAPLLALFALGAVRTTRLSWPAPWRFAALVASVALAPAAVTSVPRLQHLPNFSLPPGSVVLTGFTQATYAVPFYNPGTVQVAPAFEIGAAEPWLQSIIDQMSRGKFNCDSVKGRGFTHVVEATLKGAVPECLELADVNGAWRSWRVRD